MIVVLKEKMDCKSDVDLRIMKVRASDFRGYAIIRVRLRSFDALITRSGDKYAISLTFGGRSVLNSRGTLPQIKNIMLNAKQFIEAERNQPTYDRPARSC